MPGARTLCRVRVRGQGDAVVAARRDGRGGRRSRRAGETDPMRAVRLHSYHQDPSIDEIPEPEVTGPLDVVVKIGGAGVCRTDLHIIEGQWDAVQHPELP